MQPYVMNLVDFLNAVIAQFTQLWPTGSLLSYGFNVRGLLATLIVCLICGGMGALVVGNRMAFFSDALAHCAFAGVGLGLLIAVMLQSTDEEFRQRVTVIMVVFGVAVGLLIAYVRDTTGLPSDTVIGVFYAGAIGLGAVFAWLVKGRRIFNIEDFIFGNPVNVQTGDLVVLALLGLATAGFLLKLYNPLILASANPSLARSRRIPVRLYQYLLIVLLALMVNLCQQVAGTLLINGLLIVPAATAANLARNLREMFWFATGLALCNGIGGYVVSWEIGCRGYSIGTSGTIIVCSVLLFVASILVANARKRLALAATD